MLKKYITWILGGISGRSDVGCRGNRTRKVACVIVAAGVRHLGFLSPNSPRYGKCSPMFLAPFLVRNMRI